MKRPVKIKNIIRISNEAVRTGHLIYSHHANERMKERGILKPEVEFILSSGHHEKKKDQFHAEFESWDYAIKGRTLDGRNLRIIIALVMPNVLIVTAIDLEEEEQ